MTPTGLGILEAVLYANDLDRAATFFVDVLGLGLDRDARPLSITLRIGTDQVLLVFDPAKSEIPGRIVPSHGSRGGGHLALRIDPAEYEDWLAKLRSAGVAIEQEHTWDRGHRSIYFRDPAGNSIELITGDIWAS